MTIIWVLITAGTITLLQSLIYNHFCLKKLTYDRKFSKRSAFVGDNITMIETISNNKILPIPWLMIESRMMKALKFGQLDDLFISGDMYHKSIFYMGAYKKIKRTHYIKCVERGYMALNTASMSVGSLFNKLENTADIRLDEQLSIYPRLLKYNEIPDMFKELMGDIKVRRWILPDPFLVNGIRPYMQGDNYKDVHWGASAKTGDLKVKTYDFSSSPKMLVLLNVEISEDHWDIINKEETGNIEYGISLATTLIIWAMKNGLEAGFGSNACLVGDDDKNPIFLKPDRGESGIHNMLETMARLLIYMSTTFHRYIDDLVNQGIKDMDIVILSSYMTDRLKTQIDRLEELGNNISIKIIQETEL